MRVLDFPHVVEHLVAAAQALTLKHGDPTLVLLDLPVRAAAQARRAMLRYLAARWTAIQYAAFLAAGYPLGDGAIESANLCPTPPRGCERIDHELPGLLEYVERSRRCWRSTPDRWPATRSIARPKPADGATTMKGKPGWSLVLLLLVAVLLPALALPLVGTWVLIVPILALLLYASSLVVGERRRDWLALLCGLLGSLIATVSAVRALARVGSTPGYAERVGFGWLALTAALLAGGSTLLIRTRPLVGGTGLVVTSLVGSAAINLFFINTFFMLAVPLWWLSAFLAFMPRARGANTT